MLAGRIARRAVVRADGRKKNWAAEHPSLTCLFAARPPSPVSRPPRHVLMMLHAGAEPREFSLPSLRKPIAWRVFLDTRQESPLDIYPELDGPPSAPGRVVPGSSFDDGVRFGGRTEIIGSRVSL